MTTLELIRAVKTIYTPDEIRHAVLRNGYGGSKTNFNPTDDAGRVQLACMELLGNQDGSLPRPEPT